MGAPHPPPCGGLLQAAEVAGSVALRPVTSSEITAIGAMWERCSLATRIARFHAPVRNIPASYLNAMLADPAANVLAVSEPDGDVVALASLIRCPGGGTAELGVLVEDARQCRGIGRRLAAHLISAPARGISVLTASILAANATVADLARRVPGQFSIAADGEVLNVRVRLALRPIRHVREKGSTACWSADTVVRMAEFDVVSAEDVRLMQSLAQRVTAVHPDLVNSDATFGELAWIWGKGHASDGATWPRRLWFSFDDVIDWYDRVAAGLERTVLPSTPDEFGLKRWEAHGYQSDPAADGDTGSWTQLNERDLTEIDQPALPDGFRFRNAAEAGPEAAVRAHVDAWAPSTYTAEGYEGVRRMATYRGDLHVLVEAPDGTMAASTIMWLDEANRTAEFEPAG